MVLRDPYLIVHELETPAAAGRRRTPRLLRRMQAQLPRKQAAVAGGFRLEEAARAKDEVEAVAILEALHSSRWNRKQAAALLKIDYKALLYKMKKLSIEERASRDSLSA